MYIILYCHIGDNVKRIQNYSRESDISIINYKHNYVKNEKVF